MNIFSIDPPTCYKTRPHRLVESSQPIFTPLSYPPKTSSMLESISIQNFALIEHLRLKIKPGLTVITGETGSGKSTFLQAINLLGGGRAHTSLIRTGTEEAKVEATFLINGDERILKHTRRLRLKDSKRLTVSRTIKKSGRKNKAQLNGTSISLNQLQELMSEILEISGQHDAHHLRQSSMHLTLVDQAAGLEQNQQHLEITYQQLSKLDVEIEEAKNIQSGQFEREDFLKYQLSELKRAHLKDPNEDKRLKHEVVRLRNAERLRVNAYQIDELLYSQPSSAVEQINRSIHALEYLVEVDQSLSPLLSDLQTALAITEETARSAELYARELNSDPERLSEIEDRLAFLSNLKTKHKGTLSQVIDRQREIELELLSFENLDERLKTLHEQRRLIAQSLFSQAQALSEARRRFTPTLCRSIEYELTDLGMPEARLKIDFVPVSQGCEVGEYLIGPRGLERANLLISANPGEPLLPIQIAASGGEISRITLAIKRVIADLDPVSVYVFDEVDSGVGGPTAEALGLKLKHVSRSRQVLCITHLPQVAGIGDQHLFVFKQMKRDRTRSIIRSLNHEQRIEEISRMLGGKRITDRTRANAEELLSISST